MRIPSGDLAPARRRRPGRHRGRTVLAVVAAVGLLGGGAFLLQRDDRAAGDRLAGSARPSDCPSVAPTAPSAAPAAPGATPALRLPAPASVAFRLLNGSPRDGLAKTVGDELARRAFKVRSTGNAPKALAGPSRVYFGPGGRPAAQLVAIHVIGAELSPVPTAPANAVDLVLGTGFTRLRTPEEVTSFTARVLAGTVPPPAAAAPSATPTTDPRCA